MTLFGQDNAGGGATVASLEIFTPGGAGSWSAPKALPFNYFYYPWTYLLPTGEIFIAGPQKPARRVNWTATPVADDPARQYPQVFSQRGVNMDGTSVLLPLRPPAYAARVLIAGGATLDTQQSAEWSDLSAAAPAWQALPNMNVARVKVNSVLLPDGRVLVVGGIETLPDGGPAELFDPQEPLAGFELGPSMTYRRGYHSAAILMPDGSVVVGGDPDGPTTPHERYFPPYSSKRARRLRVRPPRSRTARRSRSRRRRQPALAKSCCFGQAPSHTGSTNRSGSSNTRSSRPQAEPCRRRRRQTATLHRRDTICCSSSITTASPPWVCGSSSDDFLATNVRRHAMSNGQSDSVDAEAIARRHPAVDAIRRRHGRAVLTEPKPPHRGERDGGQVIVAYADYEENKSVVALVDANARNVVTVQEAPVVFQLSEEEQRDAETLAAGDGRVIAMLRGRSMNPLTRLYFPPRAARGGACAPACHRLSEAERA